MTRVQLGPCVNGFLNQLVPTVGVSTVVLDCHRGGGQVAPPSNDDIISKGADQLYAQCSLAAISGGQVPTADEGVRLSPVVSCLVVIVNRGVGWHKPTTTPV